jgi:predicted nucleic acid-binding protein
VYLDTAYVAKVYLNEPDALRVRELVRGRTGLTSSAWCRAEMACVLLRHQRERALTRKQARTLHDLFLGDIREGLWNLVPVSSDILEEAEARLRRLRASDLFLRAGDAIHLTSARSAGFKSVWTGDRHLLRAAPRFGLRGRSV